MSALHMVELYLRPLALVRYARERGLSGKDVALDPGYAVHAWCAEALGAQALRPFVVKQQVPRLRILGYSSENAAELTDRLHCNAAPSTLAVLDGALASRAMLTEFPTGATFGFELRLLATRKCGQGEKDAYLVACDQQGPQAAVDRAEAYIALCAQRLQPGALVRQAQLTRFAMNDAVRKRARTGAEGRTCTTARVPVAQLSGMLQVTDPVAFREQLRSGVGRGSGLGYGMLLLRRG